MEPESPKTTGDGQPEDNDADGGDSNGDGKEHEELNDEDKVLEVMSKSQKKKQNNRMKKQNIVKTFNYSNIELTKAMEKVLDRGLNFCIQPLKLDLTQVLTDYKRFERIMIWTEYFHGDENLVTEKPTFKTMKINLPKGHKTPNGLKTYINACKSEILDPKNRVEAKNNLPKDEMDALKELIQLQKERKITIKPADKGAGIVILNFEDYDKSCKEHLSSQEDTTEQNAFYKKVHPIVLQEAQSQIDRSVLKGFEDEIISKNECDAMMTGDKSAGKFYCTFKVHKKHKHGETPPPRPIVSGVNSITENIGIFVEKHLKELATLHPTYLKDTPDFLRKIENQINQQPQVLPKNAIIVTMDVTGLYTNIPQNECTQSALEALNERQNQEVPSDFIVNLLSLILKYNIFEYDQELYQQLIGFAMGSRPAPACANLFMAKKIDKKIEELAKKFGHLEFFKRFLDDLFQIFFGTTKKLHELFDQINRIHPSIKFTMEHTSPENETEEESCSCPKKKSVPFLDTSCSIQEGKVMFDLYRKPSDSNKYLLPDSCHPNTVKENIPFSLFLRITRICSNNEQKEKRFSELEKMLLERNYSPGLIRSARARARTISREVALRPNPASTTTSRRPVWTVSWDPRLPSFEAINMKHYRTMTGQDPYLKEVFKEPPIVAHKRTKNIKDYLIRAKVPGQNIRNKRMLPGMKKCSKWCSICPYIKETRVIKHKNMNWKLNQTLNCDSSNIVYMVGCNKEKCKEVYIGETERRLKDRISDHIGYIKNRKIETPTGEHFTQKGHSLSDLQVIILEKVSSQDPLYRKERERYLIRKFNSFYEGMNKSPGC